MNHGLDGDRVRSQGLRVLSVGSLPPAWGGTAYGGVATLHATLLEGFLDPACPVEPIGVVPHEPLEQTGELPVRPFVRPPDRPAATFYERLLRELEPDAVVMHHFANQLGVTHARMDDPPPALGIAHSWHSITFRSGSERRRARAVTEEALGGLRALVAMSHHCLLEGERLGLRYPPTVEMIHHPLQPLYSAATVPEELEHERRGVAYLGSLIPRKNPSALIEAATDLPELEVVLAGHGELEDDLGTLVASLGLQDRVAIRHLDDGQARDLLLRSEAMCLPSRSETFGLAYIEALACGTPVIGFGPTLREIRDRIGVEIGEPLDTNAPQAVAAAIERVRATTWDRTELRDRTLEAFELGAISGRYADLIGRVVDRRRPPVARVTPNRPPRPADEESAPAPGQPPATAICVLGMSRSGTSLTTRILDLAGVYLGPRDELLGGELHQLTGEGEEVVARAREANPEGFWEHYRLMRLNERILRALGGNWREPPAMEPGWERSEQLAAERAEAGARVEESFSGHDLWAWKDPRNSLTLPFWQRLIPELRYVICLRNPVDVAASLQRRDGIPPERGVELWLVYLAAALVNTSDRPRLLVPYESYFADPGGTAGRLARFAGRDGAFDDPAVERKLTAAIDERLWRNRTNAAEVVRAGYVSDDVASLYLIAGMLSAADGDGWCGDAAGLNTAVDSYAAHLLARRLDRSHSGPPPT